MVDPGDSPGRRRIGTFEFVNNLANIRRPPRGDLSSPEFWLQ
jgi:hypothetical protein